MPPELWLGAASLLRLELRGPARRRARSGALLARVAASTCLRRLSGEARNPAWNLATEMTTQLLRSQLAEAFAEPNIGEARALLDAIVMRSRAAARVARRELPSGPGVPHGCWFTPPAQVGQRLVLFLHGGGYACYPRGFYDNFSSELALASRARLFALDYPLAPEHRYPAQLRQARACWEWLLREGADTSQLVLAGDSAGGNLALALLLELRDEHRPLPALTIALSPATDFRALTPTPEALTYDWITPALALHWAERFCTEDERSSPLVSPIVADLRGLPQLYIQDGLCELLHPGIAAFAAAARAQGVPTLYESWPGMPHDFQGFGEAVPQSRQALARIAQVIDERLADRRSSA